MKKLLTILSFILVFVSVLGLGIKFSSYGNSDVNNSNDNVVSSVDYSNLTYVALGDSITHGTYLETPYPYLVSDTLGFKKVYNYGINSSTISACNDDRTSQHNPMVLRYMNMIDNADIISVMAGINDWIHFHDFGTAESEENTTLYGALKIMCQGLKEKYPNSFIFFMTPYNSSVEKNREETPQLVGEIIKEICALYDIPVLDLYAKNDFIPEEHSADGLHPNQEFMNTHTAPQIAQFIKDNYKK